MNRKAVFFLTLTFFATAQNAAAFNWFGLKNEHRNYIHVVGSSTVSPFISAVSEDFSRIQNLNKSTVSTPLVESSGTRVGFQFFCGGVGYSYPDFANASRVIDQQELENCHHNGVKDVIEIKIGYDGIVIANLRGGKKINLTKEKIFLALAAEIYDEKTKKLIANPYKFWSEIDPTLPKHKITIFGPPLSSGTRDVFVDVVMEEICMPHHGFIKLFPSHDLRKQQCKKIRSDGAFIESGENDDLIVKALKKNPQAFGIFGFNFLVVNHEIQAAKINNVSPSFDSIASKHYQLSRPLFIYFKKDHLDLVPKMREFIAEIVSSETIGRDGYLVHSGLVAMQNSELKEVQKKVLSQLQN